eukprot:s738_g27.t1
MARRTSIRGTDLRLLLGEENLEVPYPAYRWFWKEVLSYAWREARHINEGEICAFNVMLKRRAKDPSKHELRYLAIVDSMVTRGAVSKGRSPSRPLNRLLRQTAAWALASDQRTLRAYRLGLDRFLLFAKIEKLPLKNQKHLDFAVGEYLNALYQEGDSLAQAGHLLSGLKRFHPSWRFKLPIATQFFKNWQKIHHPERAVPISWELLLAMAAACVTQGYPGVSLMLLLGFVCFLRTSEMLSLQCLHIIPHRDGHHLTLIVPFAKTSSGNPQVLSCSDPRVWSLAKQVIEANSPTTFLWPSTPGAFRRFWVAILALFNFEPTDYSPYGIRRGGATWFFLETASMDATLQRGRWSCGRTARQYIDQGTLAMARFLWTGPQRRRAIMYFDYILPRIKQAYPDLKIYEGLQKPGEVIFVPGDWWHGVLNLEDTVAVTQNYCGPDNFDLVWTKTRREREKIAWLWLRNMRRYSPLYQRAMELNKRDNFKMRHERPAGERLSDASSSSSESSSDSSSDEAVDLDPVGLEAAVPDAFKTLGAVGFKHQGSEPVREMVTAARNSMVPGEGAAAVHKRRRLVEEMRNA